MEKELRVVGTPHGAEILYIEDYVYSFLKTALSESVYKRMEVIVFGKEKTENQKHYYFVSGVIFEETEKKYFEGEDKLGQAIVDMQSDERLQIQFEKNKEKQIVFRDYYIYYAENENMKKYMLSFLDVPALEERTRETGYSMTEEAGTSQIALDMVKYIAIIISLAYIIISMNRYCKLEQKAEQAVYIIETILQEDIFYMP